MRVKWLQMKLETGVGLGKKSVNWYEVAVLKTDNTPRFYLFNIYFFKSAVY